MIVFFKFAACLDCVENLTDLCVNECDVALRNSLGVSRISPGSNVGFTRCISLIQMSTRGVPQQVDVGPLAAYSLGHTCWHTVRVYPTVHVVHRS